MDTLTLKKMTDKKIVRHIPLKPDMNPCINKCKIHFTDCFDSAPARLTLFKFYVNLLFIMVNQKSGGQKKGSGLSTKAFILEELRQRQGSPVSGASLAKKTGVSRVAVWKGVQALTEAGYSIRTLEKGYALETGEDDFLYPWEFGGRENFFRHFSGTGSTMDRAREFAEQGLPEGTVICAEKQSAGRGRNGRTWASRQGGLFFSVLERPNLALADYVLPAMIIQIAVAKTLGRICGKKTLLRWPNDIYVDQRKIAGVMTELSGEGDRINWLSGGIGVNVNNPVPSGRITSCAEITGHKVSRRETLTAILGEIEGLKKKYAAGRVYESRGLAAEWNSLAEGIGGRAAVIDPCHGDYRFSGEMPEGNERILTRGTYTGIDDSGRCVIRTETERETLAFSPGLASIIFL
ncbi:MAG: biotin--[acetyl-CoA-carboxylase] ligase [Treponema sp.]|jgi:BirA family biotin operon repressor/biotin-[acetyl-CoA-carboxylase] ligase|nr:biotin--[acetyl-CoA-carboxylase] ligase [Treponema sp.]